MCGSRELWIDEISTFIPQMSHFQWNTSHWILRGIFNGTWHGMTAVIMCPFRTFDTICGIKARPHGWWTKTQYPTRWIWQRDVTWPTASWHPYAISTSWDIAFFPSAMWSCYNIQWWFEIYCNVRVKSESELAMSGWGSDGKSMIERAGRLVVWWAAALHNI